MSPKVLGKTHTLFLAGHPALDFLNTRMKKDGDLVDLLESDHDVVIWLRQAGFPVASTNGKLAPPSLLHSARRLRENIRSLVEKRKAGRRGDPSVLNQFLAASQSYPKLVWNKSSLLVDKVRRQDTAGSILAPIAEAAADLLATADFKLVKHCEGESCVFWFCDQTRSHRRRWCSPELCGNRHKVAAYRSRRRIEKASRRNP